MTYSHLGTLYPIIIAILLDSFHQEQSIKLLAICEQDLQFLLILSRTYLKIHLYECFGTTYSFRIVQKTSC